MNTRSKSALIVVLAIFSVVISIYAGFFMFDQASMEAHYRQWTFYFLLISFVLWSQQLLCLLRNGAGKAKLWLVRHYVAILLALVLTVAAGLAVKGEFRILSDETNLLGTSMAMYESHGCYIPTQVLSYFNGMKSTIESVVDMRPAFFPFHIYVAHCFFGYNPSNAFLVNLVASFFILLLLYYLVEKWLGRFYGILAMLFLSAFPLFILYVRSGGFEVVNLLWSLILFAFLDQFFRQRSANWAEMVFLTLPLLAQTRYESALAVFCALPVVLYKLSRSEFANLTYRTILLPFLFFPVAWLRLVTFSSEAFQVESVEKAFGFDILWKNLGRALPFFLGENREYGMIPIITFIAIAGGIKLLLDLLSRRREGENRPYSFALVLVGFVVFHALARFFYYWGNLTLQYTSRLGIIFLPFVVFLAVYFVKSFCAAVSKVDRNWSLVFAFALIIHGWPVAANNLAVRDILFYREFKSVRNFLEKEFPDKNSYFIISDLANLYVPLEYNAVYVGHAKANPGKIFAQLRKRAYENIIVVQKINLATRKPVSGSELGPRFKLEAIYETQLKIGEYIRISRIIF